MQTLLRSRIACFEVGIISLNEWWNNYGIWLSYDVKNYANRWDLQLSAEETWLVNSSAQKVVVVFQRNIGITAKTDENKQ